MNIKLDLLLIETHSKYAMAIADFSVYPPDYTPVSPTLQVTPTAFPTATLTFRPKSVNVYTSENFQITCQGEDLVALPDGIYKVKYTINPAYEHYKEKSFIRVNEIMERMDSAFMKLDMIQCDQALKKQKKMELDLIGYYIEEAIAAANNCADQLAMGLYRKASKLLNQFIDSKCSCDG